MRKRQFVVLGLGIFGSSVAKTLSEYDCDVLAIDKDMSCVDRVALYATQCVQADMTNIDQLRHLDIGSYDVAIVGTGSCLESTVLAIMNLKELGVPYIVAKAKNKSYKQIFEKLGVDRVVRPEKEMGERVAKMMLSQNIVDLIEIDDEHSLVEINVPSSWRDKNLIELNVRTKYGMNVIGLREREKNLSFTINPEYRFKEGDRIMVISRTGHLDQFDVIDKLK